MIGCVIPQTKQELLETLLWASDQGDATPAVIKALQARGLTLGVALLTHRTMEGEDVRRN